MRRILHSRLLRCIVCFCLICCIFVNCSPIRAKAVIPESILIEAGIIVGSILLGLGVGMGADSTQDVFTGLVNDCVDVIKSDYDFIDEEGLATAYVSASIDESRSYYYAAKELVEAVRTWLFESETIKYQAGETAPNGYTFFGEHCLPDISNLLGSNQYACIRYYPSSSSKFQLITGPKPFNMRLYQGDPLYLYPSGAEFTNYYLKDADGDSWNTFAADKSYVGLTSKMYLIWSNHDIVEENNSDNIVFEGSAATSSLGSKIEVVDGIALGHVGSLMMISPPAIPSGLAVQSLFLALLPMMRSAPATLSALQIL